MLRLAHSSSAYLENVWVWTADHDLDIASQDQLDIYAATKYGGQIWSGWNEPKELVP